MRGEDFVKRVVRCGRRRDIAVRFDAAHGKGSHGRLYYGAAYTTVPALHKELKKGMLHIMLRQLGLTLKDLLED